MQLLLTGFLEKSTGAFVTELWELLISAMEVRKPNVDGSSHRRMAPSKASYFGVRAAAPASRAQRFRRARCARCV